MGGHGGAGAGAGALTGLPKARVLHYFTVRTSQLYISRWNSRYGKHHYLNSINED